ncbi:hypothetical protein SADUNF_Sadunf13G0034300 [Salix dunnii]|uniref:Uncharacterized protein n=1 Tax=Salix dunnii TaxID=1413687 RepID=A0A835JH24_9ROSI|nr:hypothetical protein SADUNF_Sadunf13G0034300 [Salix dunnii]
MVAGRLEIEPALTIFAVTNGVGSCGTSDDHCNILQKLSKQLQVTNSTGTGAQATQWRSGLNWMLAGVFRQIDTDGRGNAHGHLIVIYTRAY